MRIPISENDYGFVQISSSDENHAYFLPITTYGVKQWYENKYELMTFTQFKNQYPYTVGNCIKSRSKTKNKKPQLSVRERILKALKQKKGDTN